MHKELNKYLDFALDFANISGQIMKDNFSLNMKKEWKSDNTPVTETDSIINTLLIEKIKLNFPGHSVLGEEENYDVEGTEYVWICDPVDGTIPFSHGIPVFVFGLALTYKGTVIVAVVYDPMMNRMFSSIKGNGAYLNGNKINVNSSPELKNKSIGLIDWIGTEHNLDKLRVDLKNRGVKLMDAVSIIYFGCMVACGEFSATIFPKGDLPNNSAVKLLVEEAGGRVTDLFGSEISYDKEWHTGHLVSNGIIHDELLDMIKNNL